MLSSPIIQDLLSDQPSWIKLFPKDPRIFLLKTEEIFTVYGTLNNIIDNPIKEQYLPVSKKAMIQDPLVKLLISNLSDWEKAVVKGHDRPDYLPNQLNLLLDWGLGPSDVPEIKYACEKILSHQHSNGQFLAYTDLYNPKTKEKFADWSSVLCDHNLICSVLLLAGYAEDSRVKMGIKRMEDLITDTENGKGWKCVPSLIMNRRGPGRKDEVCPITIVDALKGYWVLPEKCHPPGLMTIGQTLLNCWKNRATSKPYMMGHGRKFRTPQPPFFWYNIGSVLDACSHYPTLVKTREFQELSSVARLAINQEGVIIPSAIKLYFNNFSFGQKKAPSPYTTYFFARIFKRAADFDENFTEAVLKLDGTQYRGSKTKKIS